MDLTAGSPTVGQVVGLELITVGSGYTSAPGVTITAPTGPGTTAAASATLYTAPTEVGMVPAVPTAGFPADWPRDGRDGGAPDPTTMGPSFLQIGTEGGFLPRPTVVPNQPIVWNADPTTFNFGNVALHGLLLGPAERADVIVDFSAYAGKTLILYNDAPAAFPAVDARVDYYTLAPDMRDTGGVNSPQPGFGPNIRTVMQIVVNAGTPVPFNDTLLNAAFTPALPAEGVFATSQEPIIVGQGAYQSYPGYDGLYAANPTFPNTFPYWGISRVQDNTLSFKTVAGESLSVPMRPKAIHDEMGAAYDEYGRMSAKLGLEMPLTTNLNQTFILQNYVDPATEIVGESTTPIATAGDGTQIWKITHNGVDTHPVHFHIFDVQLINRAGWDGAIRPAGSQRDGLEGHGPNQSARGHHRRDPAGHPEISFRDSGQHPRAEPGAALGGHLWIHQP